MNILYTFGYLQSKAERIITELLAVKTPLVDIRYNPTSRHWRYTQKILKQRCGDLYVHIKELGNEHYQEALDGQFREPHIVLLDLEAGLARLQSILDTHGRAALMCVCISHKTCHRRLVAELAKECLGVQVIHL